MEEVGVAGQNRGCRVATQPVLYTGDKPCRVCTEDGSCTLRHSDSSAYSANHTLNVWLEPTSSRCMLAPIGHD